MKLSKYLTFILFSAMFISGCTSIKKSLSGEREMSTDEFLVKKKMELILPPNFDDLPKPQKENIEVNIKTEDLDFSSVLSESKVKKKKNRKKRQIIRKINFKNIK
jgi:PBP1b-binding outer membrane lipoprotein LpoB